MQNTLIRFCPFCAGEIPVESYICLHCGRNLQEMKIAHPQSQPDNQLYHVVHDGISYGVAIAGDIKIHGLDFKKAHELASLLNNAIGAGEAG
jgi:hypothetical protein